MIFFQFLNMMTINYNLRDKMTKLFRSIAGLWCVITLQLFQKEIILLKQTRKNNIAQHKSLTFNYSITDIFHSITFQCHCYCMFLCFRCFLNYNDCFRAYVIFVRKRRGVSQKMYPKVNLQTIRVVHKCKLNIMPLNRKFIINVMVCLIKGQHQPANTYIITYLFPRCHTLFFNFFFFIHSKQYKSISEN